MKMTYVYISLLLISMVALVSSLFFILEGDDCNEAQDINQCIFAHFVQREDVSITFCNENVPRVLGHVLTVLADHNINVIDMVNLSRGDFAYSIIDVENEPGTGVMSAINSAEHVIRARLLAPAI